MNLNLVHFLCVCTIYESELYFTVANTQQRRIEKHKRCIKSHHVRSGHIGICTNIDLNIIGDSQFWQSNADMVKI